MIPGLLAVKGSTRSEIICFFGAPNQSFLEHISVFLLCISNITHFLNQTTLMTFEFQLFIFLTEGTTCAHEKLELGSRNPIFGYTIGFSITADLPSSPWLENNSQTANLQVTCWWRPPSHRFSVLYLLSLLYELKKKYEIFIFLKKSEKIWNFENRGAGARAQTQTKVSIRYALSMYFNELLTIAPKT